MAKMKRWLRFLIRATLVVLSVGMLLSVGLSVWLATWIPTQGRAWLETQLEQHLPLDLTIGTMRYSIWHGLMLEEVNGFHEPTRTIWVYAPEVNAQIGWVRLLIRRELAFRLQTTLRAPVSAEVWVSGRYRLRARDLHASMRTSSIALKTILPPLAQYVPSQLTGGTIRLNGVQVDWSATSSPTMRGRMSGEALQWTQGALQMTTDAVAEGTATLTPNSPVPAQWNVTVSVEHGTLRGLGGLPETQEIIGKLQIDNDRLTIQQLQGTTLSLTWQAEGEITALNTPAPHAELRLRTQGDVAVVAQRTAPQLASWQPTGQLEAAIACRGILPQWSSMEVTADVNLRDGTLTLPQWPHRVDALTAHLAYDHLAKRVTITQAAATIQQQPVSMNGMVHLTYPVESTVNLEAPGLTMKTLATWYRDRISLERSVLTVGASTLQLRGTVSQQADGSSSLSVAGTLDPSDLRQLPWLDLSTLHAWQIQGPLQIQLRVQGPLGRLDALTVQGTMASNELSVRGFGVRELNADLSHLDGRLILHVTQAKMAGGLVAGEYHVDLNKQPTTYLVSADLTQIDLAQLSASIPAWRKQRPEGTASSSFNLMGTTGDPSSLQGNGWINAAGERLVNIPLLTRVLQGMLGALADRLGVSVMRSAQITSITGQWHLADQRLVTEDVRLAGVSGTEPMAIYVRGSVGLDKTLDLTIEPELSDQLVLEAPSTSTLSGALLKAMGGLERLRGIVGRHRIVGTLDKPEYKFEVSLDQLLNQTFPTLF